jgi:sugar/nucleoside kinase (ribokinase family)
VTGEGLDVLAVGDLNPDLIVTGDVTPRFGQAEQDVGARLTLGGSAGIFAVGTARLGLRTALVATVGADDLGLATRAMLVDRGVDASLIAVDPARPTGLSIHLQRGDDRAILTERGAITELDLATAVDAIDRGVRHVHIASVFLVPALVRDGGELLDAARRAGATVSVDTNFDPSERFAAPDWLRDADVLIPNETEALRLAGHEDGDVLAAARDLASQGALVVVKRGAAGALAVRGDEAVEADAPRVEAGPDSIGAGDSFDAGLVRALLDGRPLPEALGLACACGGLSLRAPGGVDGQATLDEALQLSAELRSAR